MLETTTAFQNIYVSIPQNSPRYSRVIEANEKESFLRYTSSFQLRNSQNQETTTTAVSSTSQEKDDDVSNPTSSTWLKYGLLISSFSDGILSSPDAQSFLKFSLASALLNERVRKAESQVRESVMTSPCNGPDIDAFNSFEQLGNLQSTNNSEKSSDFEVSAGSMLQSLPKEEETNIRLLYIPTAMYALDPNSKNTPGKQRQRARTDGKKRRNQVVDHVQNLLDPHVPSVKVLAITLDLDDGSLKQPVGSDDAKDFPTVSYMQS